MILSMNIATEYFKTRSAKPIPRRENHNSVTLASDLLPLGDFACILLAATLSTVLYKIVFNQFELNHSIEKDINQTALIMAVLAAFLFYDQHFGVVASREQHAMLIRSHLLRFSLFIGVILGFFLIGGTLDKIPNYWVILWLTISFGLTSFSRLLVTRYLRRLSRQGIMTEVIVIVGNGPVADRLIQGLGGSRPHSIELLGIFDDKIIGAQHSSNKSAGNVAQLMELAKVRNIDWILLTLPSTAEQRVLSIVERLRILGIPIGLCPPHVALTLPYSDMTVVGDMLPVTLLADRPIKRWNALIKSGEDFILGGIITLLLLPVLAIIVLAIKFDSPGPIIFKQRRHAVNNVEFDIYKFRTMHWNPAAATKQLEQTARNDNRITRVGRFLRASSLDELPQLFNVLKGEMSLVGPRPHAVDMRTEDLLGDEITATYTHRHRVKPGMTGWSQVNGARGATDTTAQLRRRVELDLHYIENWSLFLDLKILVLTSREVLKHTNAF
jgi:Undecaprenyl-phosphate glucose phosphotransferase